VEFKGSLFGANLRQQKLNEEAEYKAILNLCETSNEILSNSLDYSIEASDPIKTDNRRNSDIKQDEYQVAFTIKLSPNNNFDEFIKYFYSNIKSISMAVSEIEDYEKLNKKTYYLTINNSEKYFFRNSNTKLALQNFFLKSNKFLHKFKILTNIDSTNFNNKKNILLMNTNNKSGFPQFHFPFHMEVQYEYFTAEELSYFSSWYVYYEYITSLENYKVFFGPDNYFNKEALFYIENCGNNYSRLLGNILVGHIPGITTKKIGNLNFEKISYFIKYSAIYNEDQLSKLSNISVKPIK
jgi:hypothetical protein